MVWSPGMPGVGTTRTATPRRVFRQYMTEFLTGTHLIQGAQSRDPGNTGNIDVLRPGLLMGKITASTFGTVGMYAPSIIGVLQSAYTSGGTELTVTAAQATELARICGQAGTSEIVAIGPPSAAGTVAVTNVTHSAIDTATGILTVSSLGANKIAGTYLAINDGRYSPVAMITEIGDPAGIKVTDVDGNSINDDTWKLPVKGIIDSSQLLPDWPSDTSLQAWIVSALETAGLGKWVFDHLY